MVELYRENYLSSRIVLLWDKILNSILLLGFKKSMTWRSSGSKSNLLLLYSKQLPLSFKNLFDFVRFSLLELSFYDIRFYWLWIIVLWLWMRLSLATVSTAGSTSRLLRSGTWNSAWGLRNLIILNCISCSSSFQESGCIWIHLCLRRISEEAKLIDVLLFWRISQGWDLTVSTRNLNHWRNRHRLKFLLNSSIDYSSTLITDLVGCLSRYQIVIHNLWQFFQFFAWISFVGCNYFYRTTSNTKCRLWHDLISRVCTSFLICC